MKINSIQLSALSYMLFFVVCQFIALFQFPVKQEHQIFFYWVWGFSCRISMNLTVKSVCWILHVSKCNVCVHDTSAEKLFLVKFPPSLSRDKTFPIRTFFLTYLDFKRFLPSPSSSWVRRPLLCINFCHLFVYLVVATSVPWLRQGRCQMGHGTFFSWVGMARSISKMCRQTMFGSLQ